MAEQQSAANIQAGQNQMCSDDAEVQKNKQEKAASNPLVVQTLWIPP